MPVRDVAFPGASAARPTFVPPPVPNWVRWLRRLAWILFIGGFAVLCLIARLSRGSPLAILPFLAALTASVVGMLGVAVIETRLWFRRRSVLRRALADVSEADGSAGACDWCGGPAGAAALRDGEKLFCGPACRAAFAAPRQSIHGPSQNGGRTRARRPLRLVPESAPFLREGLDALERGLARLAEFVPSPDSAERATGAPVGASGAVPAAFAELAGGVREPDRWREVLDQTESAVRWAFQQAGQPDPLRFNDAFANFVDLHRLRTCVAEDGSAEEVLRAIEEARYAAMLLRAEIEAALEAG